MSRHSVNFLLNPPSESTPAPLESYLPLQSRQAPAQNSRHSVTGISAAGWDSRREETKVPVDKLFLNGEQVSALAALYSTQGANVTRQTFGPDSVGQAGASALLRSHGLDPEARNRLESKWSTSWSTSWPVGGGSDRVIRVLFQCVCGYDTEARQRASRRQSKTGSENDTATPWERRAAYDYHGCLAHADVTFLESTGVVKRVLGFLEHNKLCTEATLMRIPAIPLHPHVSEVALSQLADGSSITAVQMKNIEMISRSAYRDQQNFDPLTANHRYELLSRDFTALYRTHNRRNGIDIAVAPEYNLDNWLNRKHPQFKPELHKAIFYYCARAERQERLKVCVSTKEMDDAAWLYAHNNQIILDGTFGVCSTRILLFIIMAVDEKNRGVPLAMLLFSAPTGNRATHAGYNTDILSELLNMWNLHLGSRGGVFFCPLVAITDTDTKERAALIRIWPAIILLLCRFHIRQCWTNKRKRLFPLKDGRNQASGTPDHGFWREHILGRVHALENALLLTVEHASAVNLINNEHSFLSNLIVTSPAAQKQATAGITYLEYFRSLWLDESLWRSWSQYGRQQAAAVLKRPIEGVLPTTNHLESFNGVLKRKYIPEWQRSGNRLRFDVFIHHLVIKILPEIFAQRRMLRDYDVWVNQRFQTTTLGTQEKGPTMRPPALHSSAESEILAWFADDPNRDLKAKQIISMQRLLLIPSGRPYEIWATCAATGSDVTDELHLRYWSTLHPSGSATCTCVDWLQRGGACKHLRALRIFVSSQNSSDTDSLSGPHRYYFPSTRTEAEEIRRRNKAWYGDHYDVSVTPYLNALVLSKLVGSVTGPGPSLLPPSSLITNVLQPGEQPPLAPPPTRSEHPSAAKILGEHSLFQRVAGDCHNLDEISDNDANETHGLEDFSDEDDASTRNAADLDKTNPYHLSAAESHPQSILNSQAISHQVQQRLKHGLAKVLPLLHGISSLLESDSYIDPRSSDFQELKGVLSILEGHISRREERELPKPMVHSERISTTFVTPAYQDPDRPHTPPNLTPADSHRKHLLPPSPEVKQKRKRSYGTQ